LSKLIRKEWLNVDIFDKFCKFNLPFFHIFGKYPFYKWLII
jgi:hypothetical protein